MRTSRSTQSLSQAFHQVSHKDEEELEGMADKGVDLQLDCRETRLA